MGWDDAEILTTQELAKRLKVDSETLRRMEVSGRLIPSFRLGDGSKTAPKRYVWRCVRDQLGIPELVTDINIKRKRGRKRKKN